MCQDKVLKLLKKNKTKWFSTREVSELTGIGKGSVNNNLNVLKNSRDVQRKQESHILILWKYVE